MQKYKNKIYSHSSFYNQTLEIMSDNLFAAELIERKL